MKTEGLEGPETSTMCNEEQAQAWGAAGLMWSPELPQDPHILTSSGVCRQLSCPQRSLSCGDIASLSTSGGIAWPYCHPLSWPVLNCCHSSIAMVAEWAEALEGMSSSRCVHPRGPTLVSTAPVTSAAVGFGSVASREPAAHTAPINCFQLCYVSCCLGCLLVFQTWLKLSSCLYLVPPY